MGVVDLDQLRSERREARRKSVREGEPKVVTLLFCAGGLALRLFIAFAVSYPIADCMDLGEAIMAAYASLSLMCLASIGIGFELRGAK